MYQQTKQAIERQDANKTANTAYPQKTSMSQEIQLSGPKSNHPEKKFRAGTISATVWKNPVKRKDGSDGAFRTISIERSYKDKNNAWQTTNSFRINDLPRAELVLRQAFEFAVISGSEASEEDVLF